TFLADVDGSGTVEAFDALLVINAIRSQRLSAAGGEAESSPTADTFTPLANGILASPLTFATESVLEPATGGLEPVAPQVANRVVKLAQRSVFDSPQLVALDDVLDA